VNVELVALCDIGNGCGTIRAGAEFAADEGLARTYVNEGRAVPRAGARLWSGPHWPAATVVILASGPSMNGADAAAVRAWRDGAQDRHVIAVNTTFRLAPWADVIYGCDGGWWKVYGDEVRAVCDGQLWSQDSAVIGQARMRWIESRLAPGLSRRAGVIHQGMNSGYQAIGFAHQTGAGRVILLGFDAHGSHWHGAHPRPLTNPRASLFIDWIRWFDGLASDCAKRGLRVTNCSRETSLLMFEQMPLEAALA